MRRRDEGMVLLAVLVVITIAALIGSTLLVSVDAERSGAETTLRRTQSRALAWSGAQLVMAELSAQRDEMLAGEDFDITTEWELFTDDLGRTAVVRLVPVGPGDELFVSETA
jgi:type II secretory pathway component PulK